MNHQPRSAIPGQGLVEYALIIAIVIVGLLVSLNLMGVSLKDAYCSVAGALGASTCAPPSNTTVCQDTFDTAQSNGEKQDGEHKDDEGKDKGDDHKKDDKKDIPGWDVLKGKWSLENGQMCGGPGQGRIINTCSQEANLTDYTITLDSATLDKGKGYGVYFRTSEGKHGLNGYVFQYDPGYAGGAFIFRKWVNGHELRPFAVQRVQNFDWHDTPHDIKVVVEGNTFTAYVDGQPVVTATDDSYTEGGAGLRTWDGTNVCFDGFNVQTNP